MSQSLLREYRVDGRSTDVFGRVLCSARDHHFIVDGPVQNGCPGEELTPPEAFLSGLAACGVELLQVIARDRNARLGAVRLRVDAAVDRSQQSREDLTVFNWVHLHFAIAGTDGATAASLVEGFKRR